MRFRFRLRALMVLVLVFGLVLAGLKAWTRGAPGQKLKLKIEDRDGPGDFFAGGVVTLEITDVVRDDDGCIAGFTIPSQTVRAVMPQGKYPELSTHTKRQWKEDTPEAIQQAKEELLKRLVGPGPWSGLARGRK
jgi:hypothetical protein